MKKVIVVLASIVLVLDLYCIVFVYADFAPTLGWPFACKVMLVGLICFAALCLYAVTHPLHVAEFIKKVGW